MDTTGVELPPHVGEYLLKIYCCCVPHC